MRGHHGSRGGQGKEDTHLKDSSFLSPGHQAEGSTHAIKNYVGVLATTPCHFQLLRYPFDTQRCNISFMLMNAPWTRVFHKATPGQQVDYLDSVRRGRDETGVKE